MQSFGKAMRNSLPAIGLGLMSAFAFASVTAVTAPAAVAQPTAKKDFVDNYQAAAAALKAGKYQEALAKADQAWPHAEGTAQKSPLQQIRVSAYCQMRQHAKCVEAIDAAKTTGGLSAAIIQNYDKMLAGEYLAMNQGAKALQQTKDNLAKYGGGSAAEYSFVAKGELDAKRYDEAVKYAQKAIDAGEKEKGYNVLLTVYQDTKKDDQYYATLEKVAPILKKDIYWRPLIERAKKEAKFRATDSMLDVYRTLDGAGVKLNTTEKNEMANLALNRGMAIEAEKIWAPMFKDGSLGGAGDKDAARNKGLFDRAAADAKLDRASELAQSEKDAATKPTGEAYANTAEAWLGAADYAKAVDLFQKGVTKNGVDPAKLDLIKVRLGIAQFKAGKKDDARKTWQSIKSDNGAGWLAKSWLAISK